MDIQYFILTMVKTGVLPNRVDGRVAIPMFLGNEHYSCLTHAHAYGDVRDDIYK